MAWSLKPINPTGKILRDKYSRNKEKLLTKNEMKTILNRYNKNVIDALCDVCGEYTENMSKAKAIDIYVNANVGYFNEDDFIEAIEATKQHNIAYE